MKKVLFTILFALLISGGAFASKEKTIKAVQSGSLKNEFTEASDITSARKYNEQKKAEDDKTIENKLPVRAKTTFTKMFEGYRIKHAVHFFENEEDTYYVTAENEKESIIIKIDSTLEISIFKQVKKQ